MIFFFIIYIYIFIIFNFIRETPTLSTDADSRTNTSLKKFHDLSFKKKNCGQKYLGEAKFFFGGRAFSIIFFPFFPPPRRRRRLRRQQVAFEQKKIYIYIWVKRTRMDIMQNSVTFFTLEAKYTN